VPDAVDPRQQALEDRGWTFRPASRAAGGGDSPAGGVVYEVSHPELLAEGETTAAHDSEAEALAAAVDVAEAAEL
jgi:hypothetical protein